MVRDDEQTQCPQATGIKSRNNHVWRCGHRLHCAQPFRNRGRASSRSVVGIPTEFSLFIQSEHFNRKCRVVWRKSNRIGVKFEQGLD
jgi:hypothetical protein